MFGLESMKFNIFIHQLGFVINKYQKIKTFQIFHYKGMDSYIVYTLI